MFSKIIVCLAVIVTAKAFDFQLLDELKNNPKLTKCIPTLRMIDASGKFPSGILYGNLQDLGHFDECLATERYNNTTKKTVIGKYCVVKLDLPISEMIPRNSLQETSKLIIQQDERIIVQQSFTPPGLILGWCVPNECPIDQLTNDIKNVIQILIPEFELNPFWGGICQTKDDLVPVYTTNDILIITFFAITLLLMVLSTIYDIYIGYNEKEPAHLILLAFSVKTNGKKLLAVSNQSKQLTCLHGIRFISMMWVIYGHKFKIFLSGPVMNLSDLQDWINNPANQYLFNATVSVDTFFVLSGLLISFLFCQAKHKGINFNIFQYYIHRYLRLTPLLAVIVWFHVTLLVYLGSGPFWPYSQLIGAPCKDNWWSVLLYIQNYYNPENLCIAQSWYLSVDMQLYILSPLLLIPLWRWPKQTLIACLGLLIVSMIIPFVVTYVGKLPGENGDPSANLRYSYYFPTHTRYGTWLIGFVLGYYLFKLKTDKNYKIILIISYSLHYKIILGWTLALGLLLTTLYSAYEVKTDLQLSFFNAGHRHGWALGLCWVIFACTQGYGGPVNAFLSWSVFQVLGRFTYSMYLIHFTIMMVMLSTIRTTTYFTDFYVMYLYWGDFMLCLAISVFLSLAYESPMMTIEKVLFGKNKKMEKSVPKSEIPITTIEEGQPQENKKE